MSLRRTPASTVVAALLTVAVSLLGVRLFLPGAAKGCGTGGSSCCCGTGAPVAPEAPAAGDCGCSVSPATPVPAAILASIDPVASPALVGGAADARVFEAGPSTVVRMRTVPRARSAPTQALLETFRN